MPNFTICYIWTTLFIVRSNTIIITTVLITFLIWSIYIRLQNIFLAAVDVFLARLIFCTVLYTYNIGWFFPIPLKLLFVCRFSARILQQIIFPGHCPHTRIFVVLSFCIYIIIMTAKNAKHTNYKTIKIELVDVQTDIENSTDLLKVLRKYRCRFILWPRSQNVNNARSDVPTSFIP